MEVVYLLIPVSLVLVGVIVVGFLWAARAGQFDDLERRGSDILLQDDDRPPASRDAPAVQSED